MAKVQILKRALVVQFSLFYQNKPISLTRRYFHIHTSPDHTQITPTPPTPLVFTTKIQAKRQTNHCFFLLNHQAAAATR